MIKWKKCLQCWIPASKKNDKKSVIRQVEEPEADDTDRSFFSSRDLVAQPLPIPTRRSSSSAVVSSSTEGSPVFQAGSTVADASENYIPLDICFSGPRPLKLHSLPKLAMRDIHLLDLVPPSPCSLAENFGCLSGMPEVYAPMMSHRTASRMPRGSLGGVGTRSGDRNQQVTPQGTRRELCACEEPKIPASLSAKADFRNNNTCGSTRGDFSHLPTRPDQNQSRVARTSISSDCSSVSEQKPFGPSSSSTALQHSCHGPTADDDVRPDYLHYCNVHLSQVDTNIQNLPLRTAAESRESTRKHEADAVAIATADDKVETAEGRDLHLHSQGSFKILQMTPPAPPQNSKLKAHKYVNARGEGTSDSGGRSVEGGGGGGGTDPRHSIRSSWQESEQSTVTASSERYYNVLSTNGSSSKPDNCVVTPPPLPPPCQGLTGSRKKQLRAKLHLNQQAPLRRSPDSVILPIRKYSRDTDDSSSSNAEEDGSSCGTSPAVSDTSLNRSISSSLLKIFTTRPPAPSQQLQGVEYLQLDLDQPSDRTRGSPSAIHRSQNCTIDYIEIDPCRTKALSDTKRQLESRRHNGKIYH